jgi:putative hydrolase of HD superfamily
MSDAPGESDDFDDLDALLAAYALKDESRTGWDLRGVEGPESVAGHTWGVALLCLLYAERAGVDPDRALRLAVVHDVGEAEVGDVPVRAAAHDAPVDAAEKHARERAAVETYASALGDDLLELWEEYEAGETDAAAFVGDMDLVDMVLQALVYERGGRYDPGDGADDPLDEFFDTAASDLRTDVGRALFDSILARYESSKASEPPGGDGDETQAGGDSGGA